MPNRKESYPLRDIFFDRISSGPKYATININSICNLKCEFCHIHSYLINKKPPTNIVPLYRIEKIISDLKQLSVKYIILSAEGEPSLHPQISEIIDLIKKNGFYLEITTNLTFNKETLRLSFAKADLLVVNLCAHNEMLYYKRCQSLSKNAYRNLILNLELFSSLLRKQGKPDVILHYVITRNSYRYIESILELADSLKLPYLNFRRLQAFPKTRKLALNRKETIEFHKLINNIPSSKYKVTYNLSKFIENKVFKLNHCCIGWINASIFSDGTVISCYHYPELTRLGNLNSDSFKKIWFSEKAQALRLKLKYDFDLGKPEWKNCLSCKIEEVKEIDNCLQKMA